MISIALREENLHFFTYYTDHVKPIFVMPARRDGMKLQDQDDHNQRFLLLKIGSHGSRGGLRGYEVPLSLVIPNVSNSTQVRNLIRLNIK